MGRGAVVWVLLCCCGGGTPRRSAEPSRTGEETCTKPRVVLAPPRKNAARERGTDAQVEGTADLDVSPRPGREHIAYVGRRLEIRDVSGELLFALDRGMDPAEEPLPTVLEWHRSALDRPDLLLRFSARSRIAGARDCSVQQTRLLVFRDLQPGSAPVLDELVAREDGCAGPAFRVSARICSDGDVVRLVRRDATGERKRSRRRWNEVTKQFE